MSLDGFEPLISGWKSRLSTTQASGGSGTIHALLSLFIVWETLCFNYVVKIVSNLYDLSVVKFRSDDTKLLSVIMYLMELLFVIPPYPGTFEYPLTLK